MKLPRIRWIWIAITCLSILLFVPDGVSPRWALGKELLDLGHLVLFALIAYGLLERDVLRDRSLASRWGWLTLMGMLLGVGTELGQLVVGRDFDWMDVWRDLCGIYLGMCVWCAGRQRSAAGSLTFIAIGAIYVVGGAGSFIVGSVDTLRMKRAFPVLADGTSVIELRRWECRDADVSLADVEGEPGRVLAMHFQPGAYPSVRLARFGGPWGRYEVLAFRMFNPTGAPLEIGFKIYDATHRDAPERAYQDRFNHTLVLKPGWNRVSLPLSSVREAPADREIDLNQIVSVDWFMMDLKTPITVYLSELRLE